MVTVAQLVRAPVCGTGGRGFDSHQSPIQLAKAPLCYKEGLILYINLNMPSWLNWIEHWISAPVVTGSNPVEGTNIVF